MDQAGKCPVVHGAHTTAGVSNTNWWPNALNLDILHQHDTKTNPFGTSFDYRATDNAGATTVRPTATVNGLQFLQVPVARQADGSAVTGRVFARIVNRSGPSSQPLMVQTNPVPYKPISLDTRKSTLVSRGRENMRGEVFDEQVIADGDWAWAKCDAQSPFPGVPDPTQICLRNGFDPNLLYQGQHTGTPWAAPAAALIQSWKPNLLAHTAPSNSGYATPTSTAVATSCG